MKMNKKALAILAAGHLITDLTQGALPALLPFFKDALHLSYAMAGAVIFFGNLTSSVIQPAFGYLSDRRPWVWFLPLAPAVAGLGFCLTGLAPTYHVLIACVLVSGLGVASFHPEGFKTASFFTGEKKATGMSIFAVGGNLGFALGPIVGVALVTTFGLKGTLGLAIPGLVMAGVFLGCLSWLAVPAVERKKVEAPAPVTRSHIVLLTLLIGIVIVRSWVSFGVVTFVPFFYVNYLKGDPLYAGKLVSTFLMMGALGTVVGAPLADRWGHRNFLSVSMALLLPLLVLFYLTRGPVVFVLLGMAGMVLVSSFTVTVVMAQTLIPRHLGMASGLMVGFAIGTGGLGVTFLGAIADAWGVPMALKAICILPVFGFILTRILKYPPPKPVDA
jgi:MFS transporter, FSR family, fosmidomycin resistance protein